MLDRIEIADAPEPKTLKVKLFQWIDEVQLTAVLPDGEYKNILRLRADGLYRVRIDGCDDVGLPLAHDGCVLDRSAKPVQGVPVDLCKSLTALVSYALDAKLATEGERNNWRTFLAVVEATERGEQPESQPAQGMPLEACRKFVALAKDVLHDDAHKDTRIWYYRYGVSDDITYGDLRKLIAAYETAQRGEAKRSLPESTAEEMLVHERERADEAEVEKLCKALEKMRPLIDKAVHARNEQKRTDAIVRRGIFVADHQADAAIEAFDGAMGGTP